MLRRVSVPAALTVNAAAEPAAALSLATKLAAAVALSVHSSSVGSSALAAAAKPFAVPEGTCRVTPPAAAAEVVAATDLAAAVPVTANADAASTVAFGLPAALALALALAFALVAITNDDLVAVAPVAAAALAQPAHADAALNGNRCDYSSARVGGRARICLLLLLRSGAPCCVDRKRRKSRTRRDKETACGKAGRLSSLSLCASLRRAFTCRTAVRDFADLTLKFQQ
jgi:hypothetical protein